MSGEANKGMRMGDGKAGSGGWGIPPIRLEPPERPRFVLLRAFGEAEGRRVTGQELRPRETRRRAWAGREPEPSQVSKEGSAEMP